MFFLLPLVVHTLDPDQTVSVYRVRVREIHPKKTTRGGNSSVVAHKQDGVWCDGDAVVRLYCDWVCFKVKSKSGTNVCAREIQKNFILIEKY